MSKYYIESNGIWKGKHQLSWAELCDELRQLEKENEQLKQQLKEEADRIIKLEQYVYTKLCPKSEKYDEKVLSKILAAILGDVDG